MLTLSYVCVCSKHFLTDKLEIKVSFLAYCISAGEAEAFLTLFSLCYISECYE